MEHDPSFIHRQRIVGRHNQRDTLAPVLEARCVVEASKLKQTGTLMQLGRRGHVSAPAAPRSSAQHHHSEEHACRHVTAIDITPTDSQPAPRRGPSRKTEAATPWADRFGRAPKIGRRRRPELDATAIMNGSTLTEPSSLDAGKSAASMLSRGGINRRRRGPRT
jgi:hypothetical protein